MRPEKRFLSIAVPPRWAPCLIGFLAALFLPVAPPPAAQENPGPITRESASPNTSPNPEAPVLLRFIQREGEVYHADSLVHETVLINGLVSHNAEITESSSAVVRRVNPDGTARLDFTFRTEERIAGTPGIFQWVSAEQVTLSRNPRGILEVPEDAARPIVRNIPVFPEHPLSPGDTWTAQAREVHLFRIRGTLYGPYSGEFPVAYTYLGSTRTQGRRIARIAVEYSMSIPVRQAREPVRLVSGSSSQILHWDVEAGRPHFKSEAFEFFLLTSEGPAREFRGEQEVHYRSTRTLDRPRDTARLRSRLGDTPGIAVSPAPEGIRLVVQETGPLLFAPESARIEPENHPRLDALRRALAAHPDRDIVITGHTAPHGTESGRRRLSSRRAAAVAEYLFPQGRPGPGRLFIEGAGSAEPAGSDTADRRVEILILD